MPPFSTPAAGRHRPRRFAAPWCRLVRLGAFLVPFALLVLDLPGAPLGAPALGTTSTPLLPRQGWSVHSIPSTQPFARSGAAVAFDPVGGFGVLFGGVTSSGTVVNETWVDDGDFPGLWTERTDALPRAPPPLVEAALAFDSSDGYFVLAGGRTASGAPFGGTWAFRSNGWVNLTPTLAVSPPPEAAPAMAFDGSSGSVLLVGDSPTFQMWAFRGGQWSNVTPTSVPPSRSGEALVADPGSSAVLLYGGLLASPAGAAANDTWRWSNGRWHAIVAGVGPPARPDPLVTYDPRSAEILLLTGGDAPQTWAFANSTWTSLAGVAGTEPPWRTGGNLYWDPNLPAVVLYGGFAAGGLAGAAEEWVWGFPPPPVDATTNPSALTSEIWLGAAAVVAVPIVLALVWKPKRPKPALAPAPAGVPTPT